MFRKQGGAASRGRRLRALVVSVGVLLPFGAVFAPTDSAEAAACPAVAFIGVRGSFEPAGTGTSLSGQSYLTGGFGGQVDALIDTLLVTHPDLPMTLSAIKYPATVVPGEDAVNYAASKDAGAKALIAEMNYQAKTCSASNIWLSGHSQGADVIGQVLSTPTSNQLSQRAQQLLNGVILFGDPTYKAGERINYASNTGTRSGVVANTRTTGSLNGWTGSSVGDGPIPLVRSYCHADDLICQLGSTTSTAGHNSYNTDDVALVDASSFLYSFIVDPQRKALK